MISRNVLCAVVMIVATSAGIARTARADTTYLATQHETLFRFIPERGGPGASLETFDVGRRVTGLHYDAQTGVVYGIAIEGPGGPVDFVEISNAISGVPSLNVVASLSQTYGGVTQVGELFYGFHNNGAELYSIDVSDPDNPVETYIGEDFYAGNDALAYDPVTDTMYSVSKFAEALLEVDYLTGDLTYIGTLGLGDANSVGAEWFEGQMYMAVQNGDSTDFEIGQIDVATGIYTRMFTLSEGTADYVATALAIVPEPATAALVTVVALALARRRR